MSKSEIIKKYAEAKGLSVINIPLSTTSLEEIIGYSTELDSLSDDELVAWVCYRLDNDLYIPSSAWTRLLNLKQ